MTTPDIEVIPLTRASDYSQLVCNNIVVGTLERNRLNGVYKVHAIYNNAVIQAVLNAWLAENYTAVTGRNPETHTKMALCALKGKECSDG